MSTVLYSHAGINRTETEDVTLPTDTGAAEKVRDGQRDGQRPGDGGNNTDSDGGDSSSDEERVVDSGRLLESGAVLHALLADEGEGNGTVSGTSPQRRRRRLRQSWTHLTTTMIRKDSLLPAVTGSIPLKTLLKIIRRQKKNWPPV